MEVVTELKKNGSVASVRLLRRQVIGDTALYARPAHDERRQFDSDPPGWHMYHRLDDCQPNLYQEPEKMLMLAILVDAISCFQKLPSAERMHGNIKFIEAKNWLWSDRHEWPFSYRNVCEALGFNPDYLRRGLLRRIKTPQPHTRRGEKDYLPLRKAYHRAHRELS